MLSLDDPRWRELRGAFGDATRIPSLLQDVATSAHETWESEPYASLWSALYHQGDIYTASYAAVPHLAHALTANQQKFAWTLLSLIQAIETQRLAGKGPQIPDYLADDYTSTIRALPSIAVMFMTPDRTELECRVLLSACATACGFGTLAEAVNELTPEIISKLESFLFE